MATVGLALAPRLGCGSPVPLPCKISEARRKRRPYTACGYDFIKTALSVGDGHHLHIPVRGGYICLSAVIDWHSRYVLALGAVEHTGRLVLRASVAQAMVVYGTPEIFNTDQGCQFTRAEFTQPLLAAGVKLLRDGKGGCLDNVFVERLWRSLK